MSEEQPLLKPTQHPEQVRQAQQDYTANQLDLIAQAKAKQEVQSQLRQTCAGLRGANDNAKHKQTKEAVGGFLGGLLFGALIGAIVS